MKFVKDAEGDPGHGVNHFKMYYVIDELYFVLTVVKSAVVV
jgi:hypothetical protein